MKDARLAFAPRGTQICTSPTACSLISALAVLALLPSAHAQSVAAPAPDASTVEQAWIRSAEHEKQRDYLAAAQALRSWAERYEQDYGLQLQVAWMLFQAGAYKEALPYYERADALATEVGRARAGRAWTLFRLGLHDEAVMRFEEVLAHAEDAMARRGLVLARAALKKEKGGAGAAVVWVSGSPVLQSYSDHPEKLSGAGLRVGTGLANPSGLQLSAVVAHTRYQGRDIADDPGMGMGNGQQKGREDVSGDFPSLELYLHTGWSQRRWALHGHVGVAYA